MTREKLNQERVPEHSRLSIREIFTSRWFPLLCLLGLQAVLLYVPSRVMYVPSRVIGLAPERVILSEVADGGPRRSDLLGSLCAEVLKSAGGIVETEYPALDNLVDLSDLRLDVVLSRFDPSTAEFQGPFQTADVNDGLRLETDSLGNLALVAPDPLGARNDFLALVVGRLDVGKVTTLSFRFYPSGDGLLTVSNSSGALETRLQSYSCALPMLGRGFSAERIYSGEVEIRLVEELSSRSLSVVRVLAIVALIPLELFVFVRTGPGRGKKVFMGY